MQIAEHSVLLLAERDYMYGAGSLILRVGRVVLDVPISYEDEPWYFVHGTRLGREGRELGECMVVVRGDRLARAGLVPR